ncbi:ATP-binding protein [Carboxylicivirga caseinilyticus]|uniref:sensor histidine kinase n=1 Tax=Carboxylicivirga caseinilyticus TaxID=3417572 RepID=UPI003D33FE51|nr:GHKL domain-containing protein [Marinilabiliaceae bacterium A049]
MRWLFIYIIHLIFMLSGINLKASQIDFFILHYNTHYNLPADLIKDVNMDNKGGYYLATDEGCFLFWGRESIKLKTPLNRSNYFKKLLRKKDGTLLCISDDALYEIDYNLQGPYLKLLLGKGRSVNDTIPYYYKNIFEDNFGIIWLADRRNIFSLSKGKVKKFEMDAKNASTSYQRSYQFMEFADNQLSVLSQQGYFYLYDREQEVFVEYPDLLTEEVYSSTRMDKNSYLLGCKDGLSKLEFNQNYKLNSITNSQGIVFSAFGKIEDQIFLGGSWSQGVFVLDFTGKRLDMKQVDDFPYNGVQNLYTSDNLDFIASTNLGVVVLRRKQFEAVFDDVKSGIINHLFIDNEDHIFFIRNNVIYKSTNDKSGLKPIVGKRSNDTNLVMHYSNDSVLIGTSDGNLLLYYKGKLIEELQLEQKYVIDIVKDKFGFYWIQNGHELYQVDFSIHKLINHTANIPTQNSVGAIALDTDSLLTIGTNEWQEPIIQFDYKDNIFHGVKSEFFPDSIQEYNCLKLLILKDSLLIGTSKGIYVFKQDTLSKLEVGEYSNEEVHAMASDSIGALWFSTSKGLIKWEDNECCIFTDLSGIPSKTINRDGILIDQQQAVWLATNNGVVRFNKNIQSVEARKPVVVSQRHNRFIYNDHEELEITADEYYILSLHSSYLPQYANQFRYKVVSGDKQISSWEKVSTEDELFLKISNTGKYQLLISSKNDGLSKWSSPLIIDINVVLPFYKRWYFLLVIFLILFALVGVYIYHDRKKSIREKQKLEKLVAQRTCELRSSNKELKALNKTKDRFLSIIAHDLRSPFQTLIGISSLLIQSYDELSDDERKKMIRNLQKTSELSYDLLMNLLVWTRVQTGAFDVKISSFRLDELINRNIEFAKESAAIKNIQFEQNLIQLQVEADEDMISTILRNLISNAIKFSNHNTVIRINMWTEKRKVYVSVVDQGRGMTAEEIGIIKREDSNYSTEGTDREKGTGFGLSICREFIKVNKGKMKIESAINGGSTFTFSLPIVER